MMKTNTDQNLYQQNISQVKYIISVIDTDAIMEKYKKPSTNPLNPIVLKDNISMFSSTLDVVSGQTTNNLVIKAIVGKNISWVAEPGYDNFFTPVLICNIRHHALDKVLNPLGCNLHAKESLFPTRDTCFPVNTIEAERFWFFDARVVDTGIEEHTVDFSIYHQVKNQGLKLYGYFEWMTQVQVDF